jgi:tRNA-2-methylthio-N6-dimethylallyladenosine synthase
MENQVPEDVCKKRIMELVDLVNAQTRSLSSHYEGKTIEILCEDFDSKKDMYLGRDEYGRMGYFKSEQNLIGKFVQVKITQANGVSLYGDVVSCD